MQINWMTTEGERHVDSVLAERVLATRIIRDHALWEPHGYQVRSVKHLTGLRAAALFLDPGLGKTAVVLEAFRQLKEAGMVQRMLVVAPLRVAQLVWTQEGRKWTQFRELTFSLLHGDRKAERLSEQTDIHLINPEGIPWLAQQYFGQQLPYDIVTIDELTKFKNSQAKRSKQLRKKLAHVKYRWGLTGSPAPNGYMDLFGQMLILDDGASLGRFITYFRDQYFRKGFTGFDYELQPGGGERIEQRIAPYVLRMSTEDYGSLPPLIENIISIQLGSTARKQYDEMKKEMIITLPEGVVTAANAAAVYTKLAQLANGAVYTASHDYIVVHDAKLDALEELIEELSGQPLLIGYEFQSDLARLQERFPNTPTLTGLSHKKIVEIEAAWNNGEIKMLFAHPASAGHGLNLQGSGASHVCWFSRPWDLDLYDQFIRRLLRQGTSAKHIMNHVLVVKDSIDELKGTALQDKDVTQRRLLTALNAEIIKDEDSTSMPNKFLNKQEVGGLLLGIYREERDKVALKKLGFQGPQSGVGGAQQGAPPAAGTVQPKGWGASAEQQELPAGAATEEAPKVPRGWGAPAAAAEPDAQREAINDKLRAPAPETDDEDEQPPVGARALEAFGAGVVQQLGGAAAGTQISSEPAHTGIGSTPPGTPAPAGDDATGAAPAPPAETTGKSPARSRKSAKVGADAGEQGSGAALAVGAGTAARDSHDYPVRIELLGLPSHAIAAALRAIADAYGS